MQPQRKRGIYEKYVKRLLDIICSVLAIVLFSWLYIIIAVLVCIKLGSPVIFKQLRPGIIDSKTGKEKIFSMYKFRTMTDKRGADGELLPDELRMTDFGRKLRSTSLDELPEIFNILKGDMSIIGPRPQLVRDLVFMDDKVRMRHTAKPGLSGLAQVMGRNAISWEEKFEWDLKYIEHVGLLGDLRILWMTAIKVFGARKAEHAETDITYDYGDYLLKKAEVSQEEYIERQNEAKKLLDTV